jgi:biotin carboxylase
MAWRVLGPGEGDSREIVGRVVVGREGADARQGGPWTRVDSHCYPGWTIAPFYDSLIAKLIVWAPTRLEAIERMQRPLGESQIAGRGVKTTIPFHQRVFANEQFRSGDVSTDFVEHFLAGEAAAATGAGRA